MKKFLISAFWFLVLTICLAGVIGGCYFLYQKLPKTAEEWSGYSNPRNTNVQISNTTTTLDTASTTIATIQIPQVTSTALIFANVIANHSTSTDGAGYSCQATFKRSSSTIDNTIEIGTYSCVTQETAAAWNIAFTTSSNNILLQVKGAHNVKWKSLTETYVSQ